MVKKRGEAIPTEWVRDIKNTDEAGKDLRVTAVVQAAPALLVLKNIIDKEFARIEREEVDFNNPNWAAKQASLIGEKKALRFIRNLIPSPTMMEQRIKEI
ncbi:MAG: hypothetical protein PVJ67_07160 [Candidatus Pacearchaeota archaeon]|jgi:hypothetical protein